VTEARTPAAARREPTATGEARWFALGAAEAEGALGTGPRGLDAEEAARRLEEHGPNELPPAREAPWWVLALRQLRDPLIYILLGAAAVTAAMAHHTDTGVILAVVVINAAIGTWQELRARKAMNALATLSAPHAEVVRDGAVHDVPGGELVPGDVVVLASGARVPADLRLVQAHELEVDESALTGESRAVRKRVEPVEAERPVPGDQLNMAFSGTVVTRGRGRGVVVRTGTRTELGRIAEAVRAVGTTRTPLQAAMARLGRLIGIAIVGLCALVAVIGLLRGMSPGEVFLAAVALAVASIPEGLPVVLTVTLAVGVARMARRRAIIRSLPAVETLGSTTVIGSDKTGTLTRNVMTVRAVWAAGTRWEAGEHDLLLEGMPVEAEESPPLRLTLLAGALANEADADASARDAGIGDPTELALHAAAARGGIDPARARREHPELDVLPFESEARFMATLNAGPGGRRVYVKGAPEVVLARCTAAAGEDGGRGPLDAEAARGAAAELAAGGLRVLAMAVLETDADRLTPEVLAGGWTFCGLQGMEDPVRPEAVEAVAVARGAGIRVLMLTGDHADTARAIGRQLGLGEGGALEGARLEGMSDAELDRALEEVDVFARVAPEHKLRIVQRLRARGEQVAVTGDGVNDAPALRAAHLGIAMGKGGTEVAREASDMVLADDNFATITAAVEEGRVIFANIRKVTFFLLSTGVGQILAILAALSFGWPLPILASQILWINLVTNGLQHVALAFEPGEPGLLRRPPRPAGEGVLTGKLLQRLAGVGAVLAAGTLWTFWWSWEATGDLDTARTMALTQMVVFQFFHVFNCRSLDRSILRIPLFSNRFLFLSVLAAASAHLAALHWGPLQAVFRTEPLSLSQWGVVLAVGSLVIVGGELDKAWNRYRGRVIG
jgi:calcium-translocating P-type ATPase